MAERVVEVVLPKLHPTQRIVRDCAARFRVLRAGRRWGKTMLGAALCVEAALKGGRAWWVAPTYKVARPGWRAILAMTKNIPGAEPNKSERQVILPNGGEVAVRSADRPDALRSEGLDFLVLDECAFLPERVWTSVLRPALSDRRGRVLFISTPQGYNWFYKIWTLGQERDNWASFHFTTYDNPFIDREEIEEAKRELPELVFAQEYLAEFVDLSGAVFRNVMACATLAPAAGPRPGAQYVIGVDVAALQDYNVAVVLDVERGEMVAMDRFTRVDYPVLISRLLALAQRWNNALLVVESNAAGQAVIDMLRSQGANVQSWITTAGSKALIIHELQFAFESAQIRILNDSVLVNELLSYRGWRGEGGMMHYSAPEGLHDDCVMALAIAWHSAKRKAKKAKSWEG